MQAPNPLRFKAGKRFKQLREAKNLTQQDIEKETKRRFGDEFAILTGQLSRIELGSFQRVNIDDVVRLGMIFGLTPNEVAAMYGLWDEDKGNSREPAQLRDARQMVMSLPEDLRVELLGNIEFATAMALAKVRERMAKDQTPTLRAASDDDTWVADGARLLREWRSGKVSVKAMAHDLLQVSEYARDMVLAEIGAADLEAASEIRAEIRQLVEPGVPNAEKAKRARG